MSIAVGLAVLAGLAAIAELHRSNLRSLSAWGLLCLALIFLLPEVVG